MRAYAALFAIVTLGPSLAAANPEVCPQLSSGRTTQWPWNGEELWPRCPVATPIVSIAGRCAGGAHCMQPCAATVKSGEFEANYTFTYDAAGRFLSVTGKEGGVDVAVKCLRNADGHLASCESRDETFKYTYKRGRLERAASKYRTHAYSYDDKGRLATEHHRAKYSDWTVAYAYNADGTLAGYTVDDKHNKTQVKLSYERGRLVGLGNTTYTYDDHARVIAEDDRGDYEVHVTYRYDDRGRLIDEVYVSPNSREVTSYRYSCP
jgi:YD repeat-containing protein